MNRLTQFSRQLKDSRPSLLPYKTVLQGRYVRLLPLEAEKHYQSLYINFSKTPKLFDFLLETPPVTAEQYKQRLQGYEQDNDRQHFVIELLSSPNDFVGLFCLAHADPKNKKIELGRGIFSHKLQKTPASTEALYSLLKFAFQNLGYSNVEGKTCPGNSVGISNLSRMGFLCEGIIRNDLVINGFALDAVLYSMLDTEWPPFKKAVEACLDPSNFDSSGKQKKPLEFFRQSC